MTDQPERTGEAAEIPAAVEMWNEILQMRREQQDLATAFEEHRLRVGERHKTILQEIGHIAETSAENTRARQDFELEIKMLHSVMRQWYNGLIDLHRAVLNVLERVEPGQERHFVEPPSLNAAREVNGTTNRA